MRKRGSEDGPTATTDGTTDPSRHIGSNHDPVIPLADICVLPVSELATESAVRCPARTRSDRIGHRDHRHSTLDKLDTAREAADESIEALLFDAAEPGAPIASLIDAFGRRFGPGARPIGGRPGSQELG
jgi:hypothetical protein